MSKKDSILQSFLAHPKLSESYGITAPFPSTLSEALKSEEPIINAMALIIQALETKPQPTDAAVKNIVNQYLSSKAI